MSGEAGNAAERPALRDPWPVLLGAEAVALLIVLLEAGSLFGGISPDTASYFAAAASQTPWGMPRNPLYAYFAGPLGGSATTTGIVALVQVSLHVVAAFVLYGGARLGGVGVLGAFALASAALLSQSGIYHVWQLIPESPASACLLAGFGLTLAASRSAAAFRWLVLPIALLVGISYVLRPTQMPAIVLIPVFYWIFARRNRPENRRDKHTLRAAAMLLALALPFLLQAGIRLRAVGDFNIVSFGGFQMSALAGFMLTPDIIASMPARTQPTAREILIARSEAEANGAVAPTPINSKGDRSFVSAALGYFDIYARHYDNLLQGKIVFLRRPDEDWVTFNRRLLDFSIATVVAAPLSYAAWVGGATARLTGRAIVTNATMLVSLALFFAALVPAFVRRHDLAGGSDVGAVSIVAVCWFACTGAITVLVTFPATRYIDTAAMLLPAIPLTLALALLARLRKS
jgi:hypothetical protein